jgi:hypothetical protein
MRCSPVRRRFAPIVIPLRLPLHPALSIGRRYAVTEVAGMEPRPLHRNLATYCYSPRSRRLSSLKARRLTGSTLASCPALILTCRPEPSQISSSTNASDTR